MTKPSLFHSHIQARMHGWNNADEWVMGPLKFIVKELTVDVSSAAGTFDIGWNLPANSAILYCASNNNGAITAGAAATSWSLGISSSETKYLIALIANNAKGAMQTTGFNWTTSAEDLIIYSRETSVTVGDTASADTLTGTTISLLIFYATMYQFPDA